MSPTVSAGRLVEIGLPLIRAADARCGATCADAAVFSFH
jgi:hypothetical protein